MSRANSFVGLLVVVSLGIAACSSSARDFDDAGAGAGSSAGGNAAGGRADSAGNGGAARAGANNGIAGESDAGSGGLGAPGGGDAGAADNAGAAGTGVIVDTVLTITQATLATGKTYVPYTSMVSASGGASYTWSLASGALPAGLSLQSTTSAAVKIAGTPSEAGQFPITLSVTDGSSTATVDLTLAVTHSVLFLSDRNATGVNELFLTDVGASTVPTPTRLNASFPTGGGVSSYAWSPDGSKVLYLATQSSGGAAELWVAPLATPGTAQRVSAVGAIVSQFVWLLAGNIGAYSTADGNTYLVDLSGPTPGASKIALSGSGTQLALLVSPNGKSLIVGSANDMVAAYTYVSGTVDTPTAVFLNPGLNNMLNEPDFSYDGRFAAAESSNGCIWWDLSLTSPTPGALGPSDCSFLWSPNADAFVYAKLRNASPPTELFLATFNGGSLTSTALIADGACSSTAVAPWSPDGKNALFRCGADLRAISNVTTAAVSTDFSLLPSGFLANAFTDIESVSWSPDSQWIALRADRDANAQYDLFLIRWSAPGIAYRPHANSIAPGVATWAFAQNSQSVAFVGTISPHADAGLYLGNLPINGAPPTATLVSAATNSVVQNDINWLPGSRVIVYRAAVSGGTQLFEIPVTADGVAGAVTPISGLSGSGITSYLLAPSH
jgi:Tol biopolymer transport system component